MSEQTWIKDGNGNRCSVERWGSEEKARKALATLKACSDCSDCSRCFRCSGCFRCSDCSDCSDCSRCSGCFRCSDCSRCFRCSGCSGKKDNTGTFKIPEIPIISDIHKTIYAAASQPKSLEMNDWHTCEKTHCRGGWVVTLAGEAGKETEKFYGTALAAMLIYEASGYKISPMRFFEGNEDALADMKRLAEA